MTRTCGFIAVVGAPNAGKSTLVNALVGQKVAITSAKAQTTRTRLMGIAMEGDAQIVLIDTPGIFTPARRLDRAMVAAAWSGAENADAILKICTEIDRLESDADRVMRSAMSKLFRDESDVRQLIKLKAIYELLESVSDKCEDVANVIEGVVLENA